MEHSSPSPRTVPLPPMLGRPPLADDIEAVLDDRPLHGEMAAALTTDDDGRAVEMIDERTEIVHRWSITQDNEAEWAMRKLAEAEAEIAAVEAQAVEWKAQVDDWLATVRRRPEGTARFMRERLEAYALRERAEADRATVPLPSGKVATRESKAKASICDPPDLLAWLADHPKADIAAPRKPLISEVRKIVEVVELPAIIDVGLACGCVLAGVELEGGPPADPPDEGDLDQCPEHGEQAIVDVRVVFAEWWPVEPGTKIPVPGLEIEPPSYTVTVTPKTPTKENPDE